MNKQARKIIAKVYKQYKAIYPQLSDKQIKTLSIQFIR